MTATYFVDTNVLVYARDPGEIDKHPVAVDWLQYLWQTRTGRLSVQVLQEYYQVVTRRLQPGRPRDLARADVRDLELWNPQTINAAVLEKAWSVEDRYGFSWWDALIIGAAQHVRCRYLLSEDLQHGQELEGLTVLNPFETPVPSAPAPDAT